MTQHRLAYNIWTSGNIVSIKSIWLMIDVRLPSWLSCAGSIDEAYFNLGGILLGRRNYLEAIKCYKEALKIDPKYQIAKERLEDAELALLMTNS